MNKYLKPSYLPSVTLLSGALGLVLRGWLVLAGTDEKGLLVTTHPAHILVFVLTALVLATIFLCVRPLGAIKRYQDLFPSGVLPGTGCIMAALGVLWVSLREFKLRNDSVTTVCLSLAVLAAICLVLIAIFRFRQQRPPFWFHVGTTLFFMVHLISQYRLWSPEPQLQVYFFPLLSSVFLMLTAYYSAVLDAKKTSRRWFVFCNQSALFFCFVSLWSDSWLFYLTMGFWMFTGLCSLQVTEAPSAEEDS